MKPSRRQWAIVWTIAAMFACSAPLHAEEGRVVGRDKDLADLRLVRSTTGRAVVQFGAGPLEVVKVGDRLGRTGADVVEIEAKRLVLDARFAGENSTPNRAQIIIRHGERGGTWYYEHPVETPPAARRPVSPPADPVTLAPKGRPAGDPAP
jgi:hypothetical protein